MVGYRQEPGVNPDSHTETYVAVEFHVDNWRWAGVPFYVRAGKRLAAPLTEIAVHFKRTPQALFAHSQEDVHHNVITMRIQPNEGIALNFGAKTPGTPDARQPGEHGLFLPRNIWHGHPGCLRNVAARCDARRCDALHPPR